MIPPRIVPLLDQFDFARERLTARMAGPVMDSGDGSDTEVGPMTDEEYFWEPVADCWSVRARAAGPGPRATLLAGAGPWGRDAAAYPHPWPPPVTTIAWRLSHLGEMIALRADHVAGSRSLTRDVHPVPGGAVEAVAAFDAAAAAWRTALLTVDDGALDTVGYSSYPHGSDPEDAFVDVVWWVNQELLHHGAEIALLRDLYRARPR
ncbi:DinB family protein [Streptomyces sp. AP-93]|uniref:DinB family protein n=1 Tax=Streptomyces sp. AP-93 TaxID=2929048 RepID=UPI001FB045C1|nr:DinB family protein [Streptomyces sp. AP-93]MCJ0868738.1 DinB family protein [Streptomyces sp. AP-93]